MGKKDVFLRAAKWIDVGRRHLRGACVAVSIAEHDNDWYYVSEEAIAFSEKFRPTAMRLQSFWMDDGSPKLKQRRALALLLAHAMRQTGDI